MIHATRWTAIGASLALLGVAFTTQVATAAVKPAKVLGLGNPGKLVSVAIAAGQGTLTGADSRRQLVVAGKFSTGQVRDLTGDVKYVVSPSGVVRVDPTGFVTPLGDGKATVEAQATGGLSATTVLSVTGYKQVTALNFANEVVPIFTKLGCNAGGCHGKLSGQNGFRLSLLGFYPNEDFEYLTKEDRGRRLFPAAPERSLLLLKATSTVAHGGGQRLQPDSFEYQLLKRWIAQGMPYGAKDAPVLERIKVFPAIRTMELNGRQQLAVQAYYSDGSVRDVTHLARYEPNNSELAEATAAGLVTTMEVPGDVAVMVRYQGQVDVFRASLPLGVKTSSEEQPRNFVDELVQRKLKTLGIPRSELSDDSTFLRRATLDIGGRLPTATEASDFLADHDESKRDKLIDRLLASPDYVDYFAGKWNAILRNKRVNERYTRGSYAFHEWLRENFRRNRPYDEFVRDLITASGELGQNPAVVWYRAVPTSNDQLEDTAQLFLGSRIQCARCHHHPYDRWSQDDYYGFAAFFSQVGRKNGREIQLEEGRIFHNRGEAKATNPRSGLVLKPTGLGAKPLEIPADDDPRTSLVDWMVAPENPFFAKALVNRYWKHFFGRGLVEPEDDIRLTNPPTNPQLLDALAKHFTESHYDLADLIRTICQSHTYQLSAEPNEYNIRDKQNFSRYYPKRLSAEVLYDALNQVTGTTTAFNGLPNGTRAVQLPDNGFDNYFLSVFGKPQNESACECERSSDSNLAQVLHLLNSSEVQNKLTDGQGRAAFLAQDKDRGDEEKIRELYQWVYARQPSADELKFSLAHLETPEFKDNKRQAYEDVLWALVNTKEFLFNH